MRGDAAGGEGGSDLRGILTGGAEILRQHFALLREAHLKKSDEGMDGGGGEVELVETRGHGQAQDGGMNLRRRREGFRGESEEGLDAGVELRGGGEQAVIAGAGAGGDALSDFMLDHHDGAVDDGVRGEEVKEDVGGDVVGEIADDEELAVAVGSEGGQIGSQNVLLKDFDLRVAGELCAQARSEAAVEFDGDEALGTAGEEAGDGAAAGADFDNGAPGEIAEGVGDGGLGGGADEEILAEFGAISDSHGSSSNLFQPPLSGFAAAQAATAPAKIFFEIAWVIARAGTSVLIVTREQRGVEGLPARHAEGLDSAFGFLQRKEPGGSGMHIVFAASECAPWARTGGLGEVVAALSRQVVAQGHEATVYLPYYRQVRELAPDKVYAIRSVTIPFQYYNRFAAILDGGLHDGVQVYFVDCPELFDRESLYATPSGDYGDNWERFGLFSRAVLEATKQLGVPDVFHVHDWQAALVAVYLKTLYASDPVLLHRGTVLTIHNAAYQGLYPAQTTERLLFPWDIFTVERLEHFDKFDFLKGGIVYSDQLTTVSPRYAQEIQTPEFGEGLEGVVKKRAADLVGILNGIDYAEWNPAKDGNIAAHYSAENLAGKAECRKDLLHAFGAGAVSESTAVLGMVTRLATQKGIDLVEQAAVELMRENVVLVALGMGEEYYENMFRSLAAQYPGRVMVRIAYDEMLAHKVEAGADIYLMPSRYEPCGLNQFYSMKYGTPPVVRGTGGLEDTVEEWDAQTGKGTGFKFHGYKPEEFLAAIRRALRQFEDKDAWHALMRNGMAREFSWVRPGKEYVEVYERVARARS